MWSCFQQHPQVRSGFTQSTQHRIGAHALLAQHRHHLDEIRCGSGEPVAQLVSQIQYLLKLRNHAAIGLHEGYLQLCLGSFGAGKSLYGCQQRLRGPLPRHAHARCHCSAHGQAAHFLAMLLFQPGMHLLHTVERFQLLFLGINGDIGLIQTALERALVRPQALRAHARRLQPRLIARQALLPAQHGLAQPAHAVLRILDLGLVLIHRSQRPAMRLLAGEQ